MAQGRGHVQHREAGHRRDNHPAPGHLGQARHDHERALVAVKGPRQPPQAHSGQARARYDEDYVHGQLSDRLQHGGGVGRRARRCLRAETGGDGGQRLRIVVADRADSHDDELVVGPPREMAHQTVDGVRLPDHQGPADGAAIAAAGEKVTVEQRVTDSACRGAGQQRGHGDQERRLLARRRPDHREQPDQHQPVLQRGADADALTEVPFRVAAPCAAYQQPCCGSHHHVRRRIRTVAHREAQVHRYGGGDGVAKDGGRRVPDGFAGAMSG